MLFMDRAHQVAKHLPVTTPRDVLAKMHYFHVKETIVGSKQDTTEPYIQVYAVLSAETLHRRRAFREVMTEPRNSRIPYRWGFPAKLLINRDGKLQAVSAVTAGTRLLRQWGYLTKALGDNTKRSAEIPQEWHTIRHPKMHRRVR
ncbi:Hypothetical predicted protein [Pelobates cultripes]|uniref:Uncharacterized protein n=1 Tax=Pelobates cultripes TaxID=61616 RepID=A0AAD1WTC4_PELCU|nr:Hypothetical predicted protein [Pelobates cultripes]